mmetsp:Transcript_106096/g.277097  ORF Transcript_106096/g.277097 Transcript_106096/m.277097 type:complete len:135 (+) Transcript_106096:89-493(+)
MAQPRAPLRALPAALLLTALWTSYNATLLFVGQGSSGNVRRTLVPMEAKKALAKSELPKEALALPWMEKLDIQTGSFSFSEGAENKVQIITPMGSSDDIKAWASLAPNFFFGLIFLTAGGCIESCRFFPDALTF